VGRPMSYDGYAREYAHTRAPVSWVLDPLRRQLEARPGRALVIEIGCGTGNYLIALRNEQPRHRFVGFDLPAPMLEVARSRSARVRLTRADAERGFPFADGCCQVAFAVDVVHHIARLDTFFGEARRILAPDGRCVIVTDSDENIRRRSLTRHFPELLAIELDRYPSLDQLDAAAGRVQLERCRVERCEGRMELDDAFLDRLERKCSSAMRLMAPEAHREGMKRVRAAAAEGESWLSCYTAITYRPRL